MNIIFAFTIKYIYTFYNIYKKNSFTAVIMQDIGKVEGLYLMATVTNFDKLGQTYLILFAQW